MRLTRPDGPAGPALPALDPSTPMLIHDLDVRITHVASGVTYRHGFNITTDRRQTTGDNTTDNVEQTTSRVLPPASTTSRSRSRRRSC
jgi:hypothetical protein